MKYKLRVPTKEPYAYIEAEVDGDANDAITEYHALTIKIQGGVGVSDKTFNELLDVYLKTKKIPDGADLWGQMNNLQRYVIQELKKSFKRTNK